MTKKIFIIAGEASGDFIGSKLIDALQQESLDDLDFRFIGGTLMEKKVGNSFFPMQEINYMGFLEILPHIFRLKQLIKLTIKEIIAYNPDCLITIDSPGFCLRVAEQVKQINPKIKLIHYVAPSVWAYKPKRAIKVAKIYDHLLTLLPFEPPLFEKHNLSASFTGHPVFESNYELPGDFRAEHNIDDSTTIITLMPGSRLGEIKRHLPIFRELISGLSLQIANLVIVIPVVKQEHIVNLEGLRDKGVKIIFVAEERSKILAFRASKLVVAKSGTCSLEVAASGAPMIVTYKLNSFTYFLLKRMLTIKYASLINILADRMIIPEYIQDDCSSSKLVSAVMFFINDPQKGEVQVKEGQKIIAQLGFGSLEKPSEKAAHIILSLLKG